MTDALCGFGVRAWGDTMSSQIPERRFPVNVLFAVASSSAEHAHYAPFESIKCVGFVVRSRRDYRKRQLDSDSRIIAEAAIYR